jgi:integrase
MRVLDADQARKFLAVARQTPYGALFELALTTGLRPSEYFALKWEDVDFERGSLSVVRALERQPGGGWRLEETKTQSSRRVVKLLPSVLEALAAHRRAQELLRERAGKNWEEHGFVFANERGGPLDKQNLVHRHFKKILREAGLPAIRLYDLRHTAATLALQAGVPVKVVSEMLGHRSVAITLDVYAHVLPHMQEEAAQRLAALLESGKSGEASNRHTTGTQVEETKPRHIM